MVECGPGYPRSSWKITPNLGNPATNFPLRSSVVEGRPGYPRSSWKISPNLGNPATNFPLLYSQSTIVALCHHQPSSLLYCTHAQQTDSNRLIVLTVGFSRHENETASLPCHATLRESVSYECLQFRWGNLQQQHSQRNNFD